MQEYSMHVFSFYVSHALSPMLYLEKEKLKHWGGVILQEHA